MQVTVAVIVDGVILDSDVVDTDDLYTRQALDRLGLLSILGLKV